MNIKRAIRKFIGIEDDVERSERQIEDIKNGLSACGKKFEEYDKLKNMDIDASFRGDCTVVLTGIFKGKGYVRFYDITQKEFEHLVLDYQERRKHSLIRNVDAPPQFYGAFKL